MPSKQILARNLRAYRDIYDLSQAEVAKMAKMSERGYGKLERCEVAASLDTLDKLALGLGIPVEHLISDHMMLHMSMEKPSFWRGRTSRMRKWSSGRR